MLDRSAYLPGAVTPRLVLVAMTGGGISHSVRGIGLALDLVRKAAQH